MPGSIYHMLVSTAAGLVLLGSTAALAEQKDTIIGDPAVQRTVGEQKDTTMADPHVQRTDARSSDVKNSGLTGGFYADKNKGDDWYYDFYEGPSAWGRAPQPGERSPVSRGEGRPTPRRCRPHRS